MEQRKKENNMFENDLYALLNNSVLGKTTELEEKRVDVKLVHATEENKMIQLISSLKFAWHSLFGDELLAMQMHNCKLRYNRPVVVGT